MCCTVACDSTEMMCAGYVLSQDATQQAPFTECVEDETQGCCDDTADCVSDGVCYDKYETTIINTTNMECSEDNHWCPAGFEYYAERDYCRVEKEVCYDADDEEYCNYSYGTDDINDWEADNEGLYPCVRKDTDGDVYYVYYESCLPFTVSGMDFYFYQDIVPYS